MRVIVSCLSLDGSFSGYRTILRNMSIESLKDRGKDIEYLVVIPERGYHSLNLEMGCPKNVLVCKRDFKNKWVRGLYEQFLINYMAIKYQCDKIFMPSTFGLIVPFRKTVTFIHTNTSFAVGDGLRARSKIQQLAHYFLFWATIKSSSRLVFTSETTKSELRFFFKKEIIGNVIGNGLRIPDIEVTTSEIEAIPNSPFLLSVSQFYRLKNFESVIESFFELKKSKAVSSDLLLLIVGTIQEIDYFKELQKLVEGRADVVFFSGLSDSHLSELFKLAQGYLFLSRFEGYSLTPAQALYPIPLV
jgi:glycosyltransferase involved in cell wall biosynthesis